MDSDDRLCQVTISLPEDSVEPILVSVGFPFGCPITEINLSGYELVPVEVLDTSVVHISGMESTITDAGTVSVESLDIFMVGQCYSTEFVPVDAEVVPIGSLDVSFVHLLLQTAVARNSGYLSDYDSLLEGSPEISVWLALIRKKDESFFAISLQGADTLVEFLYERYYTDEIRVGDVSAAFMLPLFNAARLASANE